MIRTGDSFSASVPSTVKIIFFARGEVFIYGKSYATSLGVAYIRAVQP